MRPGCCASIEIKPSRKSGANAASRRKPGIVIARSEADGYRTHRRGRSLAGCSQVGKHLPPLNCTTCHQHPRNRHILERMHVSEIDTPALVVDLDILERNLCRVGEYSKAHGLRLRPHTKTHKSPRIGRRQLDSGAVGLTVAKVSEAEVMLGAEPKDLLVAFPIVGRPKLERLTAVARRTRVTVALDSELAAHELADAAR